MKQLATLYRTGQLLAHKFHHNPYEVFPNMGHA
jgi:hypothetical protein